jgi:hypothetical protein
LTITGNLTVNGQTTTIDTVSTVIEDPVIVLASNQTGSPAVDIGFIGERGDENNIAFVWDESADEFVTAFTTDLVTNTTITISSYANFHTNDANVGGNLIVGGNIDITGNVTSLNVTGNITGGNLTTAGITSTGSLTASTTIEATGNITGGNVNSNATFTGVTANISGNVNAGNINIDTALNVPNITVSGNVLAGNLNSNAAVTGVTIIASGNLVGANANITNGVYSATIDATGNITGGNLITAGITSTGSLTASTTIDATGNITGGNLSAGSGIISTTGNIDGANINASSAITAGTTVNATGNITGGNLITAGLTSTGSLTASTTIDATGNITGGNLSAGSGIISTTGNIDGGNLNATAGITAGTTVNATGNITGGNLITAGLTSTGTLETVGNALIGGNLIVQGNITYINIDDLRVEDPIIILGTGPNGAPLTTDDGLDRGIFMEYYTTGLGNAFMGWDNSTGNMIIANDAYFTANDVVGINSYGTLEAGNLYIQSAIADGNIAGGNLNTAGQVVATGNVTGGNLTTGGDVTSATVTASSNIAGGNLNTTGQIVATGNIAGGNVNTAGNVTANYLIAESGIVGNITIDDLNVGNITATGFADITGNITGGNILAGSGIISTTGNINGGNLNAVSGVTAATGYFTGNVDVLGNLNATVGVVYANSGIFYGNAVTGNDAAFAGVPGFTPLGSNVTMQFAANVNSYAQLNYQNINSGNLASTDIVATADNGDDDSNYVNIGINSSTFDDPIDYPGFFPNDAYLHNHGGNLILNPETAGKTIKLMIGGVDTTDVIGVVSTTGIAVTGNVSATTALIGGNITVQGSNINSNAAVITVNSDSADTDFAVNGDTLANIFFIDAGTGTASFGTSTQTTNALVAFNASTSILMPVGNTQQRPGTGVTGMIRFNSTTNSVEVYDNSAWTAVGVPVFTVIDDQQFNGDGSTVAFTINSDQTTNSCIVSINGVVQIPTIAYSVTGTTLTFTEAPEPGDIIDVRQLTTTTSVVSISNTSGNAIVQVDDTTNNVSITGDLVPTANVTYDLGSDTARWNELFLAGNTIALGSIVIKDTGGQIGFFESNGTTPATIDAASVDTTTIANGTSSMSVIASGGNIRANVGGTTVQTISTGLVAITGDLSVTGNATLSGNILGDRVQNGTTSFDIQTPSGNANITVGATSNVAVFSSTGANITGTLGVTGNITGGNLSGTSIVGTLTTAAQTNITSVGTLGSLAVTANVTGGNLITAGITSTGSLTASTTITATGNVTGGNVITAGLVSLSSITKTGSNAVGNIGSSANYFNTVFAQATSALYADLAEKYVADAEYTPGTVVVFGGDKEVTVTATDADRAVAGVVSTNPSYIMNAGLEAEHVATVALTGRVPCRVTGTVRKGDLMVSAGYGLARAEADPRVGTVIGKALENHEGAEGVIEVVVGRF